MERIKECDMSGIPRLEKPRNGIGWTPDRFRVTFSIVNPPHRVTDPDIYTWEQATERARRFIQAHGDPVFAVTIETHNPLGDYPHTKD